MHIFGWVLLNTYSYIWLGSVEHLVLAEPLYLSSFVYTVENYFHMGHLISTMWIVRKHVGHVLEPAVVSSVLQDVLYNWRRFALYISC